MSGKPDAPTSPTHPNPKQPTNPHLQIQPLTLLQKKSCAAGHPSILQGFTKMTNERIERVQKLFRTDGETVRTIVESFQVKTARS